MTKVARILIRVRDIERNVSQLLSSSDLRSTLTDNRRSDRVFYTLDANRLRPVFTLFTIVFTTPGIHQHDTNLG